jgi:hypothetical protein
VGTPNRLISACSVPASLGSLRCWRAVRSPSWKPPNRDRTASASSCSEGGPNIDVRGIASLAEGTVFAPGRRRGRPTAVLPSAVGAAAARRLASCQARRPGWPTRFRHRTEPPRRSRRWGPDAHQAGAARRADARRGVGRAGGGLARGPAGEPAASRRVSHG